MRVGVNMCRVQTVWDLESKRGNVCICVHKYVKLVCIHVLKEASVVGIQGRSSCVLYVLLVHTISKSKRILYHSIISVFFNHEMYAQLDVLCMCMHL